MINTTNNQTHPVKQAPTYTRTCGAKKRKSNELCKSPAMANGRCRLHGGLSLSGQLSPTFKDGSHCRSLPHRLNKRYSQAMNDPDLLSTRSDIAIIESRIQEVFDTMDNGESGALWLNLKTLVSAFYDAQEKDKPEVLYRLLKAVQDGSKEYQSWIEIRSMLQERRVLAESERKRLIDMQQMITIEKAMLLVSALAGIIKQHVTDTKTLSKISNDMSKLLNRE